MTQSVKQSTAPATADRRVIAHRTRVMLNAKVSANGLELGVRMRNMSASGALLEGPVLPEPGRMIVISRNANCVAAEVRWVGAGMCGVKFVEVVSVTAWTGVKALPAGPPPNPVHTDQEVDLEEAIPYRVGEELAYVQRIIEGLADELSSSPYLIQRYPAALQSFDLANQLLNHLARVLLADDRALAAHDISMQALRNRLLR
jgi:hypothetical protein